MMRTAWGWTVLAVVAMCGCVPLGPHRTTDGGATDDVPATTTDSAAREDIAMPTTDAGAHVDAAISATDGGVPEDTSTPTTDSEADDASARQDAGCAGGCLPDSTVVDVGTLGDDVTIGDVPDDAGCASDCLPDVYPADGSAPLDAASAMDVSIATDAATVPSFVGPCHMPTSAPDEVSFIVAGTYTWVVPAGVYSVSVVAIGAGGWGCYDGTPYTRTGGAGGNLCYANDLPVTPGTSVQVVVGGGYSEPDRNSSFDGTLIAYGGAGDSRTTPLGLLCGQAENGTGGIGGTCFLGGAGGWSYYLGLEYWATPYSAGGGAAGYAGNGGQGGGQVAHGAPGMGGGGGGGGGGETSLYCVMPPACTADPGGGGGGVGLWGIGLSGGSPATTHSGGLGGSCGDDGVAGDVSDGSGGGGPFGGGQAGWYASPPGGGAVRIIWGAGRSFPFNALPIGYDGGLGVEDGGDASAVAPPADASMDGAAPP